MRLSSRALLLVAGCVCFLLIQWRLWWLALPDFSVHPKTSVSRLATKRPSAAARTATVRPLAACPDEMVAPTPVDLSQATDAESESSRTLHDIFVAAGALNLSALMGEWPSVQQASITVILEYISCRALYTQLDGLLHQTLVPSEVWVTSFRLADNSATDEAQRIVSSFGSSRIQLFTVSILSQELRASGVPIQSRLTRFQLALQAASRYVLILDASMLSFPPTMLSRMAQVAEQPEGQMSVLGVAGWSLLGGDVGGDDRGGADAGYGEHAEPAAPAMFGSSVTWPEAVGSGLSRLLAETDVLRGGWFLRTDHVPLLFRETYESASDGIGHASSLTEEAWISTMFRRHGRLRSLVIPSEQWAVMPSALAGAQSMAQLEAAWRQELAQALVRGEQLPMWRLPQPLSDQDAASSHRSRDPTPRRRVALLLVPSLKVARQLARLYAALAVPTSSFEPRLVLLPTIAGGCAAVAQAMHLTARRVCHVQQDTAFYQLVNHDELGACDAVSEPPSRGPRHANSAFGERSWTDVAAMASCSASFHVALNDIFTAAQPALVLSPSPYIDTLEGCTSEESGSDRDASSWRAWLGAHEAIRLVVDWHPGVTLLVPPPSEVSLLEWLPTMHPSTVAQWRLPRIEVAIITHRRPASLRRLMRSLQCAHYLGDAVDVTISIEAGADDETVQLARAFAWPRGFVRIVERVAKGGLVAAVVESWSPSSEHAYGLLLEDDIEVSSHFYAFLKLSLLRYVYNDRGPAGRDQTGPSHLFGISLYTPRLVETRIPRRTIDLYRELPRPRAAGGGSLFRQQLPCSWGALFFPQPWLDFHTYMNRRLYTGAPAVRIPDSRNMRLGSAVNGWSTSWKKFMIELCYLQGHTFLYPSFRNQSSFTTNHMEVGEHIGGKANRFRHRPIDFTVPLLSSVEELRTLWTDANGILLGLLPLSSLPTLDLFSLSTTPAALVAQGELAAAKIHGPSIKLNNTTS